MFAHFWSKLFTILYLTIKPFFENYLSNGTDIFVGKGPNIWDSFTHNYPQLIKDRSTGDIACDSYHQWKEDVAILKETKVHFYRFSLSWSRILPSGFVNIINKDGVRYYNDIIDELIKNNIEPLVGIMNL